MFLMDVLWIPPKSSIVVSMEGGINTYHNNSKCKETNGRKVDMQERGKKILDNDVKQLG